MDDSQHQDICRVCRSEAAPDKPLFHPCICTGSIKYIHQDCLVQWLKYSRKEYCELCNHRFSFMPIYSPDMPKRLPIRDIVSGLLSSLGTAIRYWLHYTVVAFAWLGIVPLTACRIYRCLFTGSVSSLLTLPLDMLSTENLLSDSFYGCCIVTCTLCAFISLVWLREQVIHGEGPDWLGPDPDLVQHPDVAEDAAGAEHAAGDGNGVVGAVQPPGPVAEDAPHADAPDANNGAQDDVNWNPIEWDRAAEELTWERLLGLDGSLVFLEHVFWVVSLNTLFILVFAFCPYHIGQFAILGFRLKEYVTASQFEGLLTALVGYVVAGCTLVLLHKLASLALLWRTQRLLGLCYVVVKVALLSVVEIGLFPLVCGWWLDVCSLTMFEATLSDREASFRLAPGTSMFIHWLVGMVYVFYFASFVLLLREVLRPGLLWFLKNLNDPDFNPIQEMIHLPILQHVRRFLVSLVIFGTTVLLMVWVPVRAIQWILPGFLPYHVTISSDTPTQELSLELILLQVVLPALLEQGHTKQWLKAMVRTWCLAVSYILDLRSYLLGDVPLTLANEDAAAEARAADVDEHGHEEQANNEEEEGDAGFQRGVLAAAHQALLQGVVAGGGSTVGFQAYKKPSLFPLRIALLLVLICISLTTASLVLLTLPVFVGRLLMSISLGASTAAVVPTVTTVAASTAGGAAAGAAAAAGTTGIGVASTVVGSGRVHEFYTTACGLYTCWVLLRFLTLLCSWLPKGWNAIMAKLRSWLLISLKSLMAMTLLLGLIPLLMGLLFDLIIIIPLRVPLNSTPLFYLWHDWALGVLHTKIICAITLMGPNWWLKRVIEEVYHDGLRNINLYLIVTELVLPVVEALGLSLTIPYIVSCSLVPVFGATEEMQNLVLRRIYPSLLAICVLTAFVVFQVRQFCRLYEHIKNDKYLVGRRLVNYEHRRAPAFVAPPPTAASS
ncbi:E3 ubiquitin-protein ligase MARCHF6-like isoform X2 [Ornithodoros turicata]|uniref:E3 ubiquitin-protein ligase MARCHF6-like isoform X2 n=1 Tax=Ornithodoros turicata TaxID=34597 RepID=UPI003139FBBA